MLSSSQSHAVITNYCRNGETAVRQRPLSSRTNEINHRDLEIGPVQSATVLSDCGRGGSVAATGRDSTGVSQTDAGRPLAAAAAAWLVIHGAEAGTRRESRRMSSVWRRQWQRDPLVGLRLAGQQSRPRPGATVRRRQGN